MGRGSGSKWGSQLRLSTVGLTIAIAVGIGAVGGVYLDGYLGTQPWLTILGVLLGSAAGFHQLIRETKQSADSDD
ncbi:MAG: AtpZ/AtpI family protein [Gammaproteobacteria bacterium]